MVFETYTPAFPLSHFIESFIYYKEYCPDHSIERLLPDGNVTLIIDLTETPKSIFDNDTLKEIQSCRHVWFSGIRSKPISIPSGKGNEMFIINFLKGKAYPFLSQPLHSLANRVVEGEAVLGKDILNLRDALLGLKTPNQKFLYAEKNLLKIYRARLYENPFTEYSVSKILESPGMLTINEISRKIGFSQKHFIKIFKEHVGLAPKEFLKVIRFQKAITELEQLKKCSWANIAYECGYYDQSHFIADFKTFSGFTPKQFTKKQISFRNYVAIE
jgi:AraC-like DNA-binding protein